MAKNDVIAILAESGALRGVRYASRGRDGWTRTGGGVWPLEMPQETPEAEGGGEGGAGVAAAEGVVGALVAVEETGESAGLADELECLAGATGEEFVDIALVADVEDELVARGIEDAMERDAELDDAEVGAQVASGEGKGVNEGIPDFFRKPGQFRLRDFHQVCVAADACQQFRKFR